ncbi:hypothetical protein LCGC14_0145870 [marine sediment metagenome]|uniref:Uncharacterized protein n=1 Tax=marine sediment metagenome TaxID=412755 RepID=A0A0F9XHC6_9ZZZZ
MKLMTGLEVLSSVVKDADTVKLMIRETRNSSETIIHAVVEDVEREFKAVCDKVANNKFSVFIDGVKQFTINGVAYLDS